MKVPFKRVYRPEIRPHWFFGLAYYDFDTYESVCYPIPFNVIFKCFREIYFKIKKGWFVGSYRIEYLRIYDRGYNEGYKSGRELYPCPQCGKVRKREHYLICCDCSRIKIERVFNAEIKKSP